MSKLEHFILDLDGTIAYPYPIFVKICHENAREQGLKNIDLDSKKERPLRSLLLFQKRINAQSPAGTVSV